MDGESKVLIRSTANAPWLPGGGRADVVRSNVAPCPASVVRLLLWRDGSVFCMPREGAGKLDLPMRVVPASDMDGHTTASELAHAVVGHEVDVAPVGFVRNVVVATTDGYPWPVPLAHFTVFAVDAEPAVDGTWVDTRLSSELTDRHWFPLLSLRSFWTDPAAMPTSQ